MRSKDVLKEAIREFDGTVIVVSHDREFLDGLVTKVYEFGGGVVKEHIGGIYDFLQKKQMENLNELQLSQSPTSEARKLRPNRSAKASFRMRLRRNRPARPVSWRSRLPNVKSASASWNSRFRNWKTRWQHLKELPTCNCMSNTVS